MENQSSAPSSQMEDLLHLGAALGQAHAFAQTAGRCTAAQAEALRGLRESKAHLRLGLTWEGFCAGYLRASRSQVDRIIAVLGEFGPQYFELSRLTRVSPATYRQLESNVKDGSIEVYGETVPLIPENAQKVARAVAALRAEREASYDPWVDLDNRLDALVAQFQKIYSWAGVNDICGYTRKLDAAIARMSAVLHHDADQPDVSC